MTKEDILQKMQDILSEQFKIDRSLIVLSAKLYDDLELDSIDAVDLLVKMKEFIPKKIEPESFKKARTVQDVVDLLHMLTNQA